MNNETFQRIGNTFDIIPRLLTFLVAFYEVMLSLSVEKLDQFIRKYESDSIEAVSVFVSGLKKDYDAVKNCLFYPNISNGPMEGTNNKIKMVRRRGYGRAKIELLNALMVIPWHYKDLDKSCKLQIKSVA